MLAEFRPTTPLWTRRTHHSGARETGALQFAGPALKHGSADHSRLRSIDRSATRLGGDQAAPNQQDLCGDCGRKVRLQWMLRIPDSSRCTPVFRKVTGGTPRAILFSRSSKGWPALARTHSEKRFQIVSGNAFVVLYAVICSTLRFLG